MLFEEPPRQRMESSRYLWFLLFLVLSWVGAFGIAFAVVEWRADDAEGIDVEQVTDQVACQLIMVNQVLGETGEEFLFIDDDFVSRVKARCGIVADAWILCVHTELTDLTQTELELFDTSDAKQIASNCKAELG